MSDLPGWTYLGETAGGTGKLFIAPVGTEAPFVPLRCPCGQVHPLSDDTRVAYENIARGLGPAVLMAGPEGAWLVPRIYLAAHGGVRVSELPALAERYSFDPA